MEAIRDAMVRVIARERERQKMSRRALCDRAGISNSVVQQFEDRGRDIRLVTLSRIAGALDMPIWRLVREAEDEARNGEPMTEVRRRRLQESER